MNIARTLCSPSAILLSAALCSACHDDSPKAGGVEPTAKGSLTLTSSAFAPQQSIPARYTCEGEDVSPPLAWSGVPDGTKSLALIVDDPDAPDPSAPTRTWVHWVVYAIPPSLTALPENASAQLPDGVRQGTNDWKKTGWGGPCPPIGRHRYFFKLYALDIAPSAADLGAATKDQLEHAMQGHTLALAELVGTYQKTKP